MRKKATITEHQLRKLVRVKNSLWICSDCGYRGRNYEWNMEFKATPDEFRLLSVYCPKCKTGGKLG